VNGRHRGVRVRIGTAGTGLLVAVSLVAGCAARQSSTVTDRFVRPASEGDAEVPELLPGWGEVADSLAASPTVEPPPDAEPRPKATDSLTIERDDDRLRAALASVDAESAPDPAGHRRVAAEYRRLRVYDRAYAHLSTAIDLDPSNADGYDARARVWRDWGQPELGLSDASRAVYFAPRSVAAHNTLATLLFALGLGEEAEARFEQALALDPDASYIRSNLCYVALMRGDPDRARARCDEALAQDPDLTVAHNNLALISAAEGRLGEARRLFLAGAGEAAAYFNMGMVHLARGEYAKAADEFDAAVGVSPDLSAARIRANDARRRLGRAGDGHQTPRR
jgi:Tfp pilus assembly protein PilF